MSDIYKKTKKINSFAHVILIAIFEQSLWAKESDVYKIYPLQLALSIAQYDIY